MKIISRKEAREKGLKRYFTGVPCKNGHIAERQTSKSTCVECSKGYCRDYFERNPERKRESNRNYYSKNRDEICERNKKHYCKNKEARLEKTRQYYRENRNARLEYSRDHYIKNKETISVKSIDYRLKNRDKLLEYSKNHYQLNKDYYLEKSVRRHIQKKRASLDIPSLKDEIVEIYRYSRTLSENTGEEMHVDHIVPIVNDLVCGLHIPCNLQVITKMENLQKCNKFTPYCENHITGEIYYAH